MCATIRREDRSLQTDSLAGVGQLSLLEHALCPLDARQAVRRGSIHESRYDYTDRAGQRRTAQVRVLCPLGLLPSDEFYLWGLLALTLAQPQPTNEFHATPHYCLRQLRVIDQQARRGGRQYSQFAQALERLSSVTYQNDGFYDPLRREHRRVGFGFFSYSLPLDPSSSRAWRIVWDSVFFELAVASGGHLRFDLAIYRQLDPASRRLFLLISKLFRRQPRTPPFDLRCLGQDVLGFAPSLTVRDLKVKVKRCLQHLVAQQVVAMSEKTPAIRSGRRGNMVVQLTRGTYYDRRHRPVQSGVESPLAELMRDIGLGHPAIARCLTRFPTRLLQQWLDITLAAREKHGPSFFKKSAAAYFIDNVQQAAQGKRTPPDWWHDLAREERRLQAKNDRQEQSGRNIANSDEPKSLLVTTLTHQFQAAGQSPLTATANAQRLVEDCQQSTNPLGPSLLQILTTASRRKS